MGTRRQQRAGSLNFRMNQEIKKIWVDALTSGEFQQGRGSLHNKDEYCCLGVLCELHRRITNQGKWVPLKNFDTTIAHQKSYQYVINEDDKGIFYLPIAVMEWAELSASNPQINLIPLGAYNDSRPYNFQQIAKLIDQNL